MPRRRQAGEGSISAYTTKSGSKYLIKYSFPKPDGTRAVVLKRGFQSREAAARELRQRIGAVERGTHVAPNRVTVGGHFDQWLGGLRRSPSTVASYRKNIRLHVEPHVGQLRLDQLTGLRLTALYKRLEADGRVDGKGSLAPRTVRYIHTIIHAGLTAAVRDGLLAVNPADRADPPSARSAASPEMRYWSAEELRTFLDGPHLDEDLGLAWRVLAMTGMRRGELLALRWGDVDWKTSTISVRRSAVLVKAKGEGERIIISPPKSGRARVVDLDPDTLARMRSYRTNRAAISLILTSKEMPVFGDINGDVRHPERFSRQFRAGVARVQHTSPGLPTIRLHDLRHTHATSLLRAGVPVKVVAERLGHASPMVTLGVYAHVMPGMQRQAAETFADMVYARP